MATFRINFFNNTDVAMHFCVYQQIPDYPGLKSVAWKVRRLPPRGNGKVAFTLTFGTALAEWDVDESAWVAQQLRPAELGKKYNAKFEQTDIPSIEGTPAEDTDAPDKIAVVNTTNKPLDIGFTLDGDLLLVDRAVPGGCTAFFKVHPTYYIAVYHGISEGRMADTGIQLGPVRLRFTDGYTSADVEVTDDNGRLALKQPRLVPYYKKPRFA